MPAAYSRSLPNCQCAGARGQPAARAGRQSPAPSERRIAGLAAAGRQNREIAEALFVTTATVEFHLRNAFRKLGITTRGQPAESLWRQKPSGSHQSPSLTHRMTRPSVDLLIRVAEHSKR